MEVKARPLAHECIYDTVASILDSLPRGTVLDVPAGEGALASRLIELGFDLHCCDLYPEIFRLPNVEIKRGDLAVALPYNDGSFDIIVCVEGLEHIENPHQAIREFERLIRPGGHIVVSIPNILNVEERLKWLLYGYTSHFKPLSHDYLAKLGDEYHGREEVALHINRIAYSDLRYLLQKSGFNIVRVFRDRPKKNSWAYLPVVSVIRWVNRLQSAERKRERWSVELQSDEILLGGNTLIVHAVRG